MIRAKLFILLLLSTVFVGAEEAFELPPMSYSKTMATDKVAQLAKKIDAGELSIEAQSSKEFLRWVLNELDVPEESQVLVFSKTSLQIRLISPQNPRALYFSDDIYVGWVPGGIVEIIASDPNLGVVFYAVDYRKRKGSEVFLRSQDCMSCHATTRTEGVPGVFVRSVFPDMDGQPLGHRGGFLANDLTEMKDRWGGYYLTGSGTGVEHMGNRIYPEDGRVASSSIWHEDLKDVVDTDRYLQPTSDIVSLMMLEHQTLVHNILNRESMKYRRTLYLSKAIDKDFDPLAQDTALARGIKSGVKDIVDVMLFRNEAAITGDGVQGSDEVIEALRKTVPKNSEGRTLKDPRLYPRLMKHRCSYMIYSQAFDSLPKVVKKKVLDRIKEILTAEKPVSGYEYLGKREKKRIVSILTETYPPFAELMK